MPPVETQLDQIKTVNHHLRAALNQVDEAVIIVAVDPLIPPGPRIYFANRKAAHLTGIAIKELAGLPLGKIYDPEWLDDLLAKLPIVAAKRQIFQTEKRLLAADQQFKRCRWTISSMYDESDRLVNYILTFRELPEAVIPVVVNKGAPAQPQEEETPEALLEKSKVESLAFLAGSIAHDFNNYLTPILVNLSLATLGTSVNDEIRRNIEDAAAAAENAKALTQQLLGFAKGGSPKRKVVDLSALVQKASRLATMGSNVRCEFRTAGDLQPVEVEETQIIQVFHNLLINARQAMPAGGSIQITCEHDVIPEGHSHHQLAPGTYVVTTVQDSGSGIEPENLQRIFKPYFTTKKTGTGLGLATCLMAVQRHRGTITVTSQVNVGTVFKIYLPVCAERIQAAAPEDRKDVVQGDGGAVLVVDDQDAVRAAAVQILKKLGFEAIPALTGEEALRLYTERLHRGEPISAVLMDMTLPGGMSGDEAMRQIRRLDPNVRTIATSGYFEEDSVERLKARGYVAVLPKPYTAENLSAVMHRALAAAKS